MKNKMLAVMAAGICVAGILVASNASATAYNIDFIGGGWSAVGQVDVVGGVADSGYLDVTYGATTVDYDYLAPVLSGIVQNNNGDNLPYGDNVVNVGAIDPFDQNGLLFLTAPDINNHTAGAGIYLSADQYHGYVPNLNGYGNSPGFGWGNPNVDGTVTLSSVSDSSSTIVLFGASLTMIFFIARRKGTVINGTI